MDIKTTGAGDVEAIVEGEEIPAGDRSQAILERLRSQILAVERRGGPDGADDPQACRWFDFARRASRDQVEDEQGIRPGKPRSHSFQEQSHPKGTPARTEARTPTRTPAEVANESRPSGSSPPPSSSGFPSLRTGWTEIDACLGGFPVGVIHELLGVEWGTPKDNAPRGRASGSTFESSTWIPPMGMAIRLAAVALREIGGDRPWHGGCELPRRGVLWVGRAIRPDPDALWMPRDGTCLGVSEGVSEEVDASLVSRSIFLDPQEMAMPCDRRRDVSAVSLRGSPTVWAIEQAVRHQAFAAVIADARGMSMGDSRRLQVAASAGGLPVLVLLLRESREASARSVASFRWRVEPCVRAVEDDPAGEGGWCLRLIRGRAGLPIDVRRRIEGDGGFATLVGADPWRVRGWTGGGKPRHHGAGVAWRSSCEGFRGDPARPHPSNVTVPAWSERACAG